MAPTPKQQASNTASLDNSACPVSLRDPTVRGNTVVIIATARIPPGVTNAFPADPVGFSGLRVLDRRSDDVAMVWWVKQNAAPITGVVVTAQHQSLQAHVLELAGSAQADVVDRVAVLSGDSRYPTSGPCTTTQADELIVGAIVNQYYSTTQDAFTGGFTKLSEKFTPATDLDTERHRLTVHAGVATGQGTFALGGRLSSGRDWIAAVVAFKSAVTGPIKFSSLSAPPMLTFGGRGDLTVFGRLTSLDAPPVLTFGGSGWMGPFEGQFLLGGRNGLLVGEHTDYRVEKVEGLGGWDLNQADSDNPHGDGAQRGVDRQAARLLMFHLNFDGPDVELEAAMQALLAAVRPQRTDDWPLYYRLAGMPLQMVWCRPMSLAREISADQLILTEQKVPLRCADPRIYGARERQLVVPSTPTATGPVTAVAATNAGNGRAYPVIRIRADSEVSRIQLVNVTGDVAFEVEATIRAGGELIGDMPARVKLAPRPAVTIDGQPKYGSWVSPREPFYLSPDPVAPGGVNALYLRTVPTNAAVTCVLTWQDTSWG